MTDTNGTQPAAIPPATEARKRDRIKEVMAYGALVYLFAFTILVFFHGVPEGASGAMIDTLAAAAIMLAKDVYGFIFGSSQGSEDKSFQITALTTTPVPTSPNA